VGVHLLGQLAGDLDRLDLRGEGAREHALDEVLNSCFEVSKDADRDSPWLARMGVGARPGLAA
jgi:hypothetical protein